MNESTFKETRLGLIPIEWKIEIIKNIGTVYTGKTPSTKKEEYWNSKDIPFITPGDISDNLYVSRYSRYVSLKGAERGRILDPKSVMIVCIGSTIGKVALNKKRCITNQQINSIICNEENNPVYISYAILNRKRYLRQYAGVAAVPIVKKSLFETFRIICPTLVEQTKMASILENIANLIQTTQQLIEKLQECKKGLMQRLFAEGFGHNEFKDTKLGRIPKDWDIAKMSDLINFNQTGLDLGKVKQNSVENGKPYLKMNNITLDGFLDFKDVVYVDLDSGELEKYQLESGDFLFNVRNSLKLVGKSAVYNSELYPIIFNNNIVRYRFNEKTNTEFVNYYLHTRTGRAQIHRMKASITSVVAIYKKDILKIKIILPTKQEQKQIVIILKNVDRKIILNKDYIKKLQEVKVGLMHVLLTGKKRVLL